MIAEMVGISNHRDYDIVCSALKNAAVFLKYGYNSCELYRTQRWSSFKFIFQVV